jgi:glycerol-3-phosphate dehydrogenase (NAD(P)+)
MTHNIVIIGAGRIGSAIKKVLIQNGATVELWDKDPSLVIGQKPLSETVPSASFVFLCAPSFAVREIASNISPMLTKEAVIVSLAKSIEEGTQKTMDEVLAEVLPKKQQFIILAGPLLAEEIEAGDGGVAVAASRDKNALRKISELFNGTNVKVETTGDVRGSAICGVLKNIYAMGLGISCGLGWGDNLKGWLAGASMKEMTLAIKLLGGKTETACGAAGFGDFIATGFSRHSSNRGFGEKLASGAECLKNSEGCRAVDSAVSLLGKHARRFPIMIALKEIIKNGKDPKTVFEKLYV